MPVPPVDPVSIAALADELPVAVWVGKVPGGEVLYVNRAFFDVLGMPPPEEATRGNYAATYGIYRSTTGEPYPEGEMPFEAAVRAGTTVVLDDLVLRHDDGREIPLRVWARPMRDAKGEITHVVEAFADISAEVKAKRAQAASEERLLQAQRMEAIGRLAGGIAHDFNNLLATTKLLTSILAEGEARHDRQQILEQLDQVSESGVALTRGLLAFARRGKLVERRFVLDDVVARIGAIAARTFDRRVALAVETAATGLHVEGDPSLLEQVVLNLALNAQDAVVGEGRVTLRTREPPAAERPATLPPGRWLALEVEDTGTGIDPAVRDRIFEPYVTTKETAPRPGTGLGLAVAFGTVQSHGGLLEVARTGPGGTTMRAWLPIVDPPAAAAARPAREEAPVAGGTGGAVVLVVDDDPQVRVAVTRGLRQRGFTAEVAEDGDAALRRVAAGLRPDVVLLDVTMPGTSARDTLAGLRRTVPDLPVIVTTGCAPEGEVQELLAAGATSLLPKPYDLTTLARVVSAARR